MTKLLIANWKMQGTRSGVRDFSYRVNAALADSPSALQVVFCPPVIYLASAQAALPHNARLNLGAQNVSAELNGAFTGEISAAMLAETGAKYVLVGHSERRTQQGESDRLVYAKASAAQAAGLVPVVCIGESLAELEAGQTSSVIARQLQHFVDRPVPGMVVAYEPVWAIGSGKTPQIAEIEAVHAHIKTLLGSGMAVLYGGSVKPANAAEILAQPSIDGALIGGASLEVASMCAMMDAVKG